LNSRQKLIGQIFGGLVFYFVYRSEGFSDTLDMFGVAEVPLGIFYGVFIIFWLVRFSNAVNLTDGIDGFVAGLGTISFSTYEITTSKHQHFDVM
ncbi:phospho-N-acetylmuramoyl-pentapeptide-transferase, partial [Enterococcus faecalis]